MRRTERDITTTQCKEPVILVIFQRNLNFSTDVRKFLKHQVSWKSVQTESNCFMRTDG